MRFLKHVFFHKFVVPRPLIQALKYFWNFARLRGVIPKKRITKRDSNHAK